MISGVAMDRDQHILDGITKVLVARKALQQHDVQPLHDAFRASAIERFEEFLVEEEVVTKEQLLAALQEYYQLPAIDVVGLLLSHELVIKFPKDLMLNHGFVPYQLDGDILQVIAARPNDADLSEIMVPFIGQDVVFAVGIYSDICDAVKEFYDPSITSLHEVDIDEDEDFENMAEEVIDEE
jgi:hypothetical protein